MASDQNTEDVFTREVDPYDDVTLRRLAPEAYGCLGFDPVTAQLLVRGYFVTPNAAAALKIRIEAELTGHLASANRPQKRRRLVPDKPLKSVTKPVLDDEPGDRAPWDDDMTNVVVNLHAKRVSFKNISEHIPGKGIKACQEHYYRVVKDPKWKEMHDKTRHEHDTSGSDDSELQELESINNSMEV